MYGLAYSLNWNMQGLVMAVDGIRKQKGGGE